MSKDVVSYYICPNCGNPMKQIGKDKVGEESVTYYECSNSECFVSLNVATYKSYKSVLYFDDDNVIKHYIEEDKKKKEFLVGVKKYNIVTNSYEWSMYKVLTDNIYRIIGKIHACAITSIEQTYYAEWSQERENWWKLNGVRVKIYREPKLAYDLN